MNKIKNRPKLEPLLHTLVTVYKLEYPGHKQVQQFYRYFYGHTEDTLYVDSCPGCGNRIGYAVHDHKCSGRLTANPVNIRYVDKSDKVNEQALKDYLAQLDHPVYLSD